MHSIDGLSSKDVSYLILSGREYKQTGVLQIHNRIYEYWKTIWREVFDKTGTADDLSPDDFFRQDLIACLLHREEIVGIHLYTFFNLCHHATTEHSYFSTIGPNRISGIVGSYGIRDVMSLEYLTVTPRWRKSELGIPWGEVLVSLGMKVLSHTECDAAFGTARTDIKVDKMTERLGFKVLEDPIKKYDYECAIVLCQKGSDLRHPDEKTAHLIDALWDGRTDHTGITTEKSARNAA